MSVHRSAPPPLANTAMHLRFTRRSQLVLEVKNSLADPAPRRCLAAMSPVSQGASGKTYFSGKLWLWISPARSLFSFVSKTRPLHGTQQRFVENRGSLAILPCGLTVRENAFFACTFHKRAVPHKRGRFSFAWHCAYPRRTLRTCRVLSSVLELCRLNRNM